MNAFATTLLSAVPHTSSLALESVGTVSAARIGTEQHWVQCSLTLGC